MHSDVPPLIWCRICGDPAYALGWQWMLSHWPIHGAIDAFAIRSEISLIPVAYNTGNTEIDLWIMHIGWRYWKLLDYFYLIHKGMCLVSEMMFMNLCCRWTILRPAGLCIPPMGLPYSLLSTSMNDGRVKIRVFPGPSTSNCTVSFPDYSYPACFTSGNIELLPYRIPDSRE